MVNFDRLISSGQRGGIMNKYQESLDYLKKHAYEILEEIDMGNNSSYFFQPMDDVNEIAKPLQELVDKATPMKPIPLFIPIAFLPYRCRKCRGLVNNRKQKFRYCPHCGQTVDWSD